ncbi:MAG: hypothetical protein R2879_19745 [Saprospiraceae bacterium]
MQNKIQQYLSLLQCPITKNSLQLVEKEEIQNFQISNNSELFKDIKVGIKDTSGQYFYPIFDEIIVLHEQYATFIGKGEEPKRKFSFDKKRVFDYYNEVSYKVKDALNIYEDSPKWVDYREVSKEYMHKAFLRAGNFFPKTGTYLLDIASGPIGLPEYMDLGAGYEYRVCVDISINALIQAKINLEKRAKKGFISVETLPIYH